VRIEWLKTVTGGGAEPADVDARGEAAGARFDADLAAAHSQLQRSRGEVSDLEGQLVDAAGKLRDSCAQLTDAVGANGHFDRTDPQSIGNLTEWRRGTVLGLVDWKGVLTYQNVSRSRLTKPHRGYDEHVLCV
jgi:hypothetical protein